MDPRRPPARQDGAIRHDHRARLSDAIAGPDAPPRGPPHRQLRRRAQLRCQQGPLPGPGLVGAKVRAVITLAAAMRRDSGMVQATFGIRYEVQGAQRPPCVAETDYLYS